MEAEQEDGEAIPVFYRFGLWANELINGQPRLRGVDELLIPADPRKKYGPANGNAYPAWGGDLGALPLPEGDRSSQGSEPAGQRPRSLGMAAAAADGRRQQGPDRLASRLPDGSRAVRPARRHADAKTATPSSEEAEKLVNTTWTNDAQFPFECNRSSGPTTLTR